MYRILFLVLLAGCPLRAQQHQLGFTGSISESGAASIDYAYHVDRDYWGVASLGFGEASRSLWVGARRHKDIPHDRFTVSQEVKIGVHRFTRYQTRLGLRGDLGLHFQLDDLVKINGVRGRFAFGVVKVASYPIYASWSLGFYKVF